MRGKKFQSTSDTWGEIGPEIVKQAINGEAEPASTPAAQVRSPAKPSHLRQDIHFCTSSDGVRIAYAEVGQGRPLISSSVTTRAEQSPTSSRFTTFYAIKGHNLVVPRLPSYDAVDVPYVDVPYLGNIILPVVFQNCVIRNFVNISTGAANGVLFAPSASAKLVISDSHITRNGVGAAGGGVVVKPTGGFSSVTLNDVRMDDNSNGLVIDTTTTAGGALATVSDSSASANSNTGIALIGGVGATQSFLTLHRVMASNNSNGIGSSGANSNVLLSNSAVSGNNTGLLVQSSGKIVSYLNNVLLGNTTAGAPTSTQAGQ